MNFKGEVKVVYINGNYETGDVSSVSGILVDETFDTITVAKIMEKVMIFRRHIIKVEDLELKGRNRSVDFKRK